ncbi:MAG: AraC family transcriptional regulator [Myxococcota bacterium]
MSDDLLQRLLSLAPTEGRTASVIPGVWFFHHDRPTPPARYRASTLSAGLVVRGRKAVRVDGTELWYDPASYFVVRGDTVYDANVAEAPYLAIGLEIPPQVVVETLLALGPAAGPTPAVSAFVAPVDEPLRDAMVRLVTTSADPVERRILAPLALREVVYRLLCTKAAAVVRSGVGESDREPIRAAMAYLEAHAERRITVQDLARHVGMSASHFAHRFREAVSTTPMQYLKHVRMDRARTLLLAHGLRPSEIAPLVGYASLSHFTRDFKRQFGVAPGAYARTFETAAAAPVAGSGNTTAASALHAVG